MNNYIFSLPDGVVAQMKQFSNNYGSLLESVRIVNEIPALQNLIGNMKIVTECARAIKMPILTQIEIDNLYAAYNAVAPLLSEQHTQTHTSGTAISDIEDEPNDIISENEEETIDISETAISDAIDNVIPIFDEMELPEPQREVVDKCKKSEKLTREDIFTIIEIIIMLLTFFHEIADDFQKSENDYPSQAIVIDNHSEFNITQYFNNVSDGDSSQNDSGD